MSKKSWALGSRDFENAKTISGSDLGRAAAPLAVKLRTLSEGMSRGVDVIRIENGVAAVEVLPSRGMSVWKAWVGDDEIGWRSPVQGPILPSFVPISEPSGLGWLDGFDELLVRCGLESNGAPEFNDDGVLQYPLHGRIGNRPAHDVTLEIDDESGEVAVTGVVDEIRFHFLKVQLTSTLKVRAGEQGFRIHDSIENLSASAAEIQLIYHINFGHPLLDGGSQLAVPLKELVPRNDHAASGIGSWNEYQAETAGYEEQVYFATLRGDNEGKTETLLKNAHGTRGVSLHFKTEQLPCFTVWKNTTSMHDGYVTGLEPGTNYPNPRSYEGEQGRVAKLKGRGSVEFDVQVQIHTEPDDIAEAEQRIAMLSGSATIHNAPQKGWCSDA